MQLINIYSAAGKLEAEMIKAFLEAQGITVILSQESVGRTLGLSVGNLGIVEVLVPDSQVKEANTYLTAIENGDYVDFNYNDHPDEPDFPNSDS